MAFKKKTTKKGTKIKDMKVSKNKKKLEITLDENEADFEASDFHLLAASDANYTADPGLNDGFNISVNYGATGTVTGTISATFTPISAISSVPLTAVNLIGENTRWSVVGTNLGSFPVNLVNDGTGASQVITVSAQYDNTQNAEVLIDSGLGFQYWLGAASLSAGSSDTLGYPASASSYGTSESFDGALTAEGIELSLAFTPSITISGTVDYNTVSDPFVGTATFTTSSILGDNTGVSAVNYDIYLSGSDTSHFSTISTVGALPGVIGINTPVSFSTTFDNTYLHASDATFTVVAVVSTGSVQPSGSGWFGTFAPDTTDFSGSTQTIGACGDAGAPSGVTGFTSTNGQSRVRLNWTNPTDTDLSATKVQFALGTVAPSAHTEGTTLYVGYSAPGTAYATQHTGLTANQNMAYSIWTVDTVSKWSTALVQTSATPFANNIYDTDAFPYQTNAQIRARLIDEGII